MLLNREEEKWGKKQQPVLRSTFSRYEILGRFMLTISKVCLVFFSMQVLWLRAWIQLNEQLPKGVSRNMSEEKSMS